ncbi:hypothetical protein A2346_02040 [candidate division WOR-1 bacterium RIFOXYB12_FULL_52_16]|nr:MAG: hypothetical protein A2346_02040 [candidate division WOR-1 bacterium RIFOXYB12_FULL_52_16]
MAAGLLGLLLLSLPASARFISLRTSITASVSGKTALVEISAVNKGDEAAYGVWSEFSVLGETYTDLNKRDLPPTAKYRVSRAIPLAGQKGSYPLLLTLHYTDANQYQFSTLSAVLLSIGGEPKPPVLGVLKPAAFSGDGKLELGLKNLSTRETTVHLDLFLPRELCTDFHPIDIKLAAGSSRTMKVEVTNFSALPGSTYQLFLIAETDGSKHATAIIPGRVRIEEPGINPAWLIVPLAFLGVFFLAAQFIKR